VKTPVTTSTGRVAMRVFKSKRRRSRKQTSTKKQTFLRTAALVERRKSINNFRYSVRTSVVEYAGINGQLWIGIGGGFVLESMTAFSGIRSIVCKSSSIY